MDHTAPDPPSAAAASGIAIREDGTVLADGRPLALSPTELALLRALVAAGGRALSRREILFAMHGCPGNVREESLNFTVHALRAKLGRHWPSLRTVWGRGYAWQPATVSDLRRTLRRRIALATSTALAVLASFGAFVAVEMLSLRRPDDAAPGPAPRSAADRRTRDMSQITLGRGPLCASATDRGVPGREPKRAIDGDPATCYESVSPAIEMLSLRRPDDAAPGPAPRSASDRRTRDMSQITLGRGSLCASATDRGVPGREPKRAIDGDPATCYESVSPAIFGWHWFRVDWATNRAGRVSVLLGRPEDGPPYLPVLVEVSSDGRTWRLCAEPGAATNAAVFEVSESFSSLRVRPAADSDRPFAVREVSADIDPAETF